ncbi:MAG: GNAT family N-acetyltransferase [Pseudomonadota bacterium]
MADYPAHLAHERRLSDGRSVLIRPIRLEDEGEEREFFDRLSSETRRMRFMTFVRSVSDKLIHFFTHIDYDKHMAFVCETTGGRRREIVGEARYVAYPDGRNCEFGVVIADAWHKSGIAGLLMEALIRAARERGMRTMEGLVLRENRQMVRFVRQLGFEVSPFGGDPTTVRALKQL